MSWITHLDGGPKRVNHAAVAIGHKIYSFGGYCTGENSKDYCSMDVHVLNTTTFRWTKHPVSDLPYFENDDILPYKRYGHTAVVYKDKIYIWGGRNDRASDSTVYCFDTVWHCWTAPKASGTIPIARDGHSACVWKQYMIVFGGYEEERDTFGDFVYALNLDTMTWAEMPIRGLPQDQPMSRDFHTTVVYKNRMYLFGGRGAYSIYESYPNSMWYLDLEKLKWVLVETTGEAPIGRRSHSCFLYENKIYIFGGYNALDMAHYNDMYRFDPELNTWDQVTIYGDGPCPRRRQATVLVKDRLFLFGGTSPLLALVMDSDDDTLTDHCDLYILDFKPTLKTLCILAVRKYGLDETNLPRTLRRDMGNMFSPNKITMSRPNNSAG